MSHRHADGKSLSRTSHEFVLTVDAGRARLLRLEPVGALSRLVPVRDFENLPRRVRPSQQFSDPRPGLQRSASHVRRHAVDDRRDAHLREYERRFARRICDHVAALHRQGEIASLVLAATPSMLACLRRTVSLAAPGLEVTELAVELTQLGPVAVHDYLAGRGLLPARGRLARQPAT
jgi:protein required for attachment to host cells